MLIHEIRTVRGNISTGKRPIINYEGAEYRNDTLAEDYSLVGLKLTFEIDTEDLRIIRAFLPDGSELGLLTARGKWGIIKHSLRQRKAINKLVHEKLSR